MSAVYPPGGTIVQSLKRTFADVPVDEANGNAVSTVEFLEASESLTTIFGTALSQSFAKRSMTNCAYRCYWWCCFRPRQEGYPWQRRGSSNHPPFHRTNLTATYRSSALATPLLPLSPLPSRTLSVTSSRLASTLPPRAASGSSGTSNPPRTYFPLANNSSGLDFTKQGLEHNVQNTSVELSDSFRDAYGNTLKPHHSFMVKPIFSAAMSAVPYRKDFYAKLGDNPEKVQTDLEAYLASFSKVVAILKEFINSKEAKW